VLRRFVSLFRNGLRGSAEIDLRMPRRVNSPRPNPWFLIALHSPYALLETGLRMCPAEKSRDSDPVCSGAVRSPQSGLLRNNHEI